MNDAASFATRASVAIAATRFPCGARTRMRLLDPFRHVLRNSDRAVQLLAELVEGVKNQSELQNQKLNGLTAVAEGGLARIAQLLDELRAGINNQSDLQNRRFKEIVAGIANQSDLLNRKFDTLLDERQAASNGADRDLDRPAGGDPRAVLEREPLLLGERTYNLSHPSYDANLVRNFPGRILGRDRRCDNAAFVALSALARYDDVPDAAWDGALADALVEASSVPGAEQVFERRAYIERYTADLSRAHRAHYAPGWVDLDDALFLYWLVRRVKPRTIVQSGVCNGVSTAFMMLGLAKNGPEGRLRVIDLPPVFDPNDPRWTTAGKVYREVIPEGKTSGWMVPDIYRDRFEVLNGDARDLMPKVMDGLDSLDFFYHDSDHTYNHMMFEFRQAKRKLREGGVIVGDDMSWNASLWDFADEFEVPSYNFKGAVGVAFF
ncbi:MAG TPA: class I SAM-dependent methyltransferase [Stellaceae bacterium]|nr:class I SAM-dependent methyltransferase [Stellaceae bacterium]